MELILIFVKWLIKLAITIIGYFIIPVALLFETKDFQPINKRTNPLNHRLHPLFYWWDNEDDGIDGNYGWQNEHCKSAQEAKSFWKRYIWLAWRNPVHNFSKRIGVNETIIAYDNSNGYSKVKDKIGREGHLYSVATGKSGKKYHMYYICIGWYELIPFWKTDKGIRILLGYKNFNIDKNKLPKKYNYAFTVVFTLFKTFKSK